MTRLRDAAAIVSPTRLPTLGTALRRSFDQWSDQSGVRPVIEAEFDDSALLKVFGQSGAGLFLVPQPIERAVCQQYQVERVGPLPEVRERFYVVTSERKIRHPAVAAIAGAARERLFEE
jgi:LysR family transcriptional regulator, transcriptional activator of nhaA